MKHVLVSLFEQMTALSQEEIQAIEASIPIKTFHKGTYLLRAGQIARASYYVVQGCIREYEIRDGEEKTTSFFTEGDSAANFLSMANQVPSKQNLVYGRHSSSDSKCR